MLMHYASWWRQEYLLATILLDAGRENTMDDNEQFGVSEKHVDSSSNSVEETTTCDPILEGETSDHVAECKDGDSLEVNIEEENDCNKTMDSDKMDSAVEVGEESSDPAEIHWQQVELSEDAGTEQQEPSTDCEQECSGSRNLDNVKILQYVVMTVLYHIQCRWRNKSLGGLSINIAHKVCANKF